MPRLLSCSKTTQQVRDRLKEVTRRRGWQNLKAGDELWLCVKCQGLKKGEKVEKICRVKVKSVRRERLDRMITEPAYGRIEARREGFPGWTGREFVEFWCAEMGVEPDQIVTRIEWRYL